MQGGLLLEAADGRFLQVKLAFESLREPDSDPEPEISQAQAWPPPSPVLATIPLQIAGTVRRRLRPPESVAPESVGSTMQCHSDVGPPTFIMTIAVGGLEEVVAFLLDIEREYQQQQTNETTTLC